MAVASWFCSLASCCFTRGTHLLH